MDEAIVVDVDAAGRSARFRLSVVACIVARLGELGGGGCS